MTEKSKNKKLSKGLHGFTFEWEVLEECPLCGGAVLIPNGKIQWLDMDFWYAICGKCGLKFMTPRPTQKSYQDFYKNIFWEHKTKNLGFIMQGQMWNTKRYAMYDDKQRTLQRGKKVLQAKHKEMRFKIITDTLSYYITLDKKADILEVGAGFGVTLVEIKKKFRSSVYAIEPSLEAQKTIKKTGTKILGNYAEDLEKLSKKKQKFDAIIFSHSLENTSYPLQIIKWARRCLKKNGVIYVQCSNLVTFDQMNPYHPYIFSAHSLGLLAKKAGLKPHRAGEKLHRMLTIVMKA